MKETDFELRCRKIAERMGYVVYKGGGMVGAADKVFLRNGLGFVCEIKRPDGDGVHSEDQKRHERYCTARGVDYYLVENFEQFKEVLLKYE